MSSAISRTPTRRKRAACEFCRIRKIKCCGSEPCTACSKQLFQCYYKEPEDRRRTHASRIARIRRQQSAEPGSLGPSTDISSPEPDETHDQDVTRVNQPTVSSDGRDEIPWSPRTSYPWIAQAPQQSVDPVPAQWTLSNNENQQAIDSAVAAWSPTSRGSHHSSANNASSMSQGLIVSTPFQAEVLPQDASILPSFSDGSIIRRHQPIHYANSWPVEVDEASLLPWLDSYFKRLNPIVPVLSHISVYEAMLLGRHRSDSDFGAMVLAICSIVMIQCVYTEEAPGLEERTDTARTLMQHSARMRSRWDFGQDPTIETILTSFFLFGCLFSDGQQRAAWHQLRLAVDMTCQIGLDHPDVYPTRDNREREQNLRIYLTLAVTERACALMRRHTIGLRGRPWSISLSAQQTSMFFDDPAFEFDESQSRREIAGLLCLAHLFDAIDEDILSCWNGQCRKTDGICDTTDRRGILNLTRRVMTAANRVLPSDISPSIVTPLNESQRADILITQLWLLNRIWHLTMSHGLLQGASEHAALTPEFAIAIACATAMLCRQMKAQSIEVHGMGMLEKISDIAASVQTARELVGEARVAAYTADSSLFLQALSPCEELWRRSAIDTSRSITAAEEVMSVLTGYLDSMRDGRHPYKSAPLNWPG